MALDGSPLRRLYYLIMLAGIIVEEASESRSDAIERCEGVW
jgi:hypothetical protein